MAKTTKDLSVPQLLILTVTAAGRPDRMVMPLPSTLLARGASQQRLLASLLSWRWSRRCRRQAGLVGASHRHGGPVTTRRDRPAPDLVDRKFTASGPNQLWVADTLILSWRHDQQGQHYALQLTTAGLAVVTDMIEPAPAEAKMAKLQLHRGAGIIRSGCTRPWDTARPGLRSQHAQKQAPKSQTVHEIGATSEELLILTTAAGRPDPW